MRSNGNVDVAASFERCVLFADTRRSAKSRDDLK
jgi:hypothetical protein